MLKGEAIAVVRNADFTRILESLQIARFGSLFHVSHPAVCREFLELRNSLWAARYRLQGLAGGADEIP